MTKIDAKQRYPASAGRSVREKQSFKGSILLLFGISLTLSPAFAQAQEFDIDAGPAVAGLSEFAAQADVSVVYTYDAVDGLETNEVEGVYEPDQALRLLLAGTGLSVYEGEGGAFAVATRDGGGDSDSKNVRPTPVLMAQNTVSQTANRSQNDEDEQVEGFAEDGRDTRGQIETIVVVGSRNAGVRRYEDDAQPYVVFEALTLIRVLRPMSKIS